MNKFFSIFCLITVVLLFSSCDMPDYTDEINAAYFNAGGSSGTAVCTYGQYRCSDNDSYFCGYSGNDLLWLLSKKCSYGCDSSSGKCKSSNDSGSGSNSGGNNSGSDSGNSGGNSDTSSPLCNPNPCANLANSTGICTTTHDDYVCGCKEGYNWRHKECVQIPKALGNICTGHTKCYTDSDLINCNSSSIGDFYGQDAHYAARGTCIPQKFRIDSSVSNEKTVIDENTGLEWPQTIQSEDYYWEDAINYCENLTYGGHNDWRLPNVKELLSIINRNKNNPAIDTSFFFDEPTSAYFWSSSTQTSNDKDAWYVSLSEGGVKYQEKNVDWRIHCVRGNTFSKSSFNISSVNGNEIITDTQTGLIWQKAYAENKSWAQALSYCKNSTYAGYSDWRLPNINELSSLINYEEYDPASDFPDMPSDFFWSSSTLISYVRSAWYVDFTSGYTMYFFKSDIEGKSVRCVR